MPGSAERAGAFAVPHALLRWLGAHAGFVAVSTHHASRRHCTPHTPHQVNVLTFMLVGKLGPVSYQMIGHSKTCLVLIGGYVMAGAAARVVPLAASAAD